MPDVYPAGPQQERDLPAGHEFVEGRTHHAVTVYGTEDCGDTVRTRELLDRLGVAYNYYDVDLDPAIYRTMTALEDGNERTPVVRMDDGAVLVEPTDTALVDALRASGRLR
jgi:glutaredoxin